MQERHELQSRAGGRRVLVRSEHPTRELGDVRLKGRKQEWLLVARHDGHSVQMHGKHKRAPRLAARVGGLSRVAQRSSRLSRDGVAEVFATEPVTASAGSPIYQ
jgi:hypothetical protein